MNKKALFLACVMALSLTFTACSDDNKSSTDTQANAVSDTTTTEPTTATTTEPTTEATTTTEQVDTRVFREYDTEFEIKEGQKVYFGDGSVAFEAREILEYTMDDIGYHDISLKYSFWVDGVEYLGIVSAMDGDEGPYFGSIEPAITQNLVATKISFDGCTVRIKEHTDIKEPVILSGNSEVWYTAPEDVYIEAEDYNIYIMQGVTVRESIKEEIDTFLDILTEKTGYELFNDSEFSRYDLTDHSSIFGDSFIGVAPEKFSIYLVPYEVCVSSAGSSSLVLNPENENIIDDSAAYVFFHELAHSFHMSNGVALNRTMTEGYATYMADVLLDEHPEYDCDFDSEMNYSVISFDITPQNAKEMFLTEFEESHDFYCYGYRFIHYLFETYGESIFRDIVEDANKQKPEYQYFVDSQVTCDAVIENTSETVFEDFANWLSQNEDRFDGI